VLFAVAVLIVMEVEKCLRNYLSALKYNVDDAGPDDIFDVAVQPDSTPLPEEVGRFGLNELSK
jgi:hypothetical protein